MVTFRSSVIRRGVELVPQCSTVLCQVHDISSTLYRPFVLQPDMTIAEQRQEVLRSADSWLRTPFVDNAMVKGCGVACGPLLIAVYRSIGIPVGEPKWALFPKDWHLHTQEERYYNMVAEYSKPVDKPEPGDMALFRFNNPNKPARPYCHGGIVVEWPVIIHAYWGKGVEYADVSKGPLEKREKVFLSPWA